MGNCFKHAKCPIWLTLLSASFAALRPISLASKGNAKMLGSSPNSPGHGPVTRRSTPLEINGWNIIPMEVWFRSCSWPKMGFFCRFQLLIFQGVHIQRNPMSLAPYFLCTSRVYLHTGQLQTHAPARVEQNCSSARSFVYLLSEHFIGV